MESGADLCSGCEGMPEICRATLMPAASTQPPARSATALIWNARPPPYGRNVPKKTCQARSDFAIRLKSM